MDLVGEQGSDVVSIDWRMKLDRAWSELAPNQAIQGNLDPLLLFAPWRELQANVDEILKQADGRPGHIFNLGHGILPGTPVDTVKRLAEYVHEQTARTAVGSY
jgi:uroporphyrinogen decarboxylase